MVNIKLEKILDFFKPNNIKQDSRFIIFIICLFISTILWLLNALSKNYDTTLEFPVRYINPPENRFIANTPPENLSIKVNAHGFTLLRYKFGLSFSPVILNINNIISLPTSRNDGINYTIRSSSLINRISTQLSNEIRISEIQPDEFIISLDSLFSKKVPVSLHLDLNYKNQYYLSSPIQIRPDSVELNGPFTIIETIDSVLTENEKWDEISETINKNVSLQRIQNVTIIPKEVLINIQVEQFTEKIVNAPVVITDQPDSLNIRLFPSEVKVSCMVPLSRFSEITASDFNFIIPYNEINHSSSSISISLQSAPDFVRDIKFSPGSLEYLIEIN